MIICRNPLRIVATVLARDEEDVLGAMIEHHVEQGVSAFVVTDNASADRTRAVAAAYPEVVEIIDEPCLEHRQSEWVTRMARLACRLSPDWVVHLDADEFWCGLPLLRNARTPAVACTRVLMHPPCGDGFDLRRMRHYLDFDPAVLPGECKVAHRPHPDVVVAHGNHACSLETGHGDFCWRHHYPVRSVAQFARKAVQGSEALARRGAPCERWRRWADLELEGRLRSLYYEICDAWGRMCETPNAADLATIMAAWSTPEAAAACVATNYVPAIGEWPSATET